MPPELEQKFMEAGQILQRNEVLIRDIEVNQCAKKQTSQTLGSTANLLKEQNSKL